MSAFVKGDRETSSLCYFTLFMLRLFIIMLTCDWFCCGYLMIDESGLLTDGDDTTLIKLPNVTLATRDDGFY